MRPFIELFKKLISGAVAATAIALVTRSANELAWVARRDNAALQRLRALLDPWLTDAAANFHLDWSRQTRILFPLGLAVGLMLLGAGLRALADALVSAVEKGKVRSRKSAAPKPAAMRADLPKPVDSTAPMAVVPAAGPDDATAISPRAAAPVQSTDSPQVRIGRYEIVQELGRGAMGVVYKARDPQIGRTVAIKAVLEASGDPVELEAFRQRFEVEARAAGQLSHPSVVSIYDIVNNEHGHVCMVMEFVEGPTLQSLASAQRLPLRLILDLVAQVARGLDYAHTHGVIHRDIKPANILIAQGNLAKISDFGIAKMDGTNLTTAGQIVGTPAFMSPEQCSGAMVDHRSDIFSLGTILYWLCTGQRPFTGKSSVNVAYQLVNTQPAPMRSLNPELPAELETIVDRCLAKVPDRRFPKASQLAAELDHLRQGLSAGA